MENQDKETPRIPVGAEDPETLRGGVMLCPFVDGQICRPDCPLWVVLKRTPAGYGDYDVRTIYEGCAFYIIARSVARIAQIA